MAFPTKSPYKIKHEVEKPVYESVSADGDIYRRVKSSNTMEHFELSFLFRTRAEVDDLIAHYEANAAASFTLSIPIDGSGVNYTVWYEQAPIPTDMPRIKQWDVTVRLVAVT